MKCRRCQSPCIKKGFQKKKQKYFCKSCSLHQLKTYTYKLCNARDEQVIIKLNNIGVGINGISMFTGISKAHVINKIRELATKAIMQPPAEFQQEYEMDELRTFIKNKKQECYIIYAINKKTKRVIDLVVGARTKENISKVVRSVLALDPKKIFTDRLNIYQTLIDKSIHRPCSYAINHIERFNLTLRTHLKRLARRTICFSKNKDMLENCVKLYLHF